MEDSPSLASANLTKNSKYLLLSTLDNNLALWDIKDDKKVQSFEGTILIKLFFLNLYTEAC